MVVPGFVCAWIIDSRVAAVLSETTCLYPKAGAWEVSTIPNTQASVADGRPR